MTYQYVYRFCKAVSDLWLAETICDRSADLLLDEQQLADTRQQVREKLQFVREAVSGADLATRLDPEIERFESALPGDPLRKLSQRCDHLRERLLDELYGETHLHVPRGDSPLLAQREPFGGLVGRKFPGSTADIVQAARCLALQQPTACVFHLMRAMEAAVRRLANKLGMTITPQTTWRQLTGSMDIRIKALPQGTPMQKVNKEAWESARINLHHLGSAIRNNTMHPTAFYTQDEARHIFNSVGVTLQTLCALK